MIFGKAEGRQSKLGKTKFFGEKEEAEEKGEHAGDIHDQNATCKWIKVG